MSDSNPDKNRLEDIAEQAMTLLQRGGRDAEAGASLLYRNFGRVLQRRWEYQYRIPESEAEELLSDALMKLCRSRFDGRTRAIVWINMIARSVALDAISRHKAKKRGAGEGEIEVDEEYWDYLSQSVASDDLPLWVRLCVERAMHLFGQEQPKRAEVLQLISEGCSAAEIAIHFGATPPPSAKQETAARNRVLDARKVAKEYFAHCKDET